MQLFAGCRVANCLMVPSTHQASQPVFDSEPADGYKEAAGTPRPWCRFLARHLDLLLLAGGVGVLVALAGWENKIEAMNEYAFIAALYVLWTIYEATLLAVLGTTPGKFLFGLWIAREEGGHPRFLQAFGRAWSVLFMGLGLGLPIVWLITCHTSYRRLDYNGFTSWDESRHLVVSSPARSWWVWLLAWLGAAALCATILIGAAIMLVMRAPAPQG
jgi:uncharacterized RDD family membrane protein YckC